MKPKELKITELFLIELFPVILIFTGLSTSKLDYKGENI